MPCEVLTTLQKIESLRQLMHAVAREKDLTDPEVVNISQRLDRLLNQYHALVRFHKLGV